MSLLANQFSILHLLIRALLRRPSLLLCDEVTSSVDALAERDIIDALRGRRRGGGSGERGSERGSDGRGGGASTVVRGVLSPLAEDDVAASTNYQRPDYATTAGWLQIPSPASLYDIWESASDDSSNNSGERTIITVAHRLSSVVHCDRIIVLQKGSVVEQGTHSELLQIPNGVYKSMWEVQNNVGDDTTASGDNNKNGHEYGFNNYGYGRNTRMYSV